MDQHERAVKRLTFPVGFRWPSEEASLTPEVPDEDKTAGDQLGLGQDEQWPAITEMLGSVIGTWDLPVLRHLGMGVSRPADLQKSISAEGSASLSRKVLVETLRRLLESELVSRQEAAAWACSARPSPTASCPGSPTSRRAWPRA
jgi:DNA-binding HxlR family transcriptional regulator